MLDLGIFGNQKRPIGCMNDDKYLSLQKNRIVKIIEGLWKESSSKNAMSAFRSTGILFYCQSVNGEPRVFAGVRRGADRAVRHYNESLLERLVDENLPLSCSQNLARNKLALEKIYQTSFKIITDSI